MWPRIINTALGIWLMAAPSVLNYDSPAATNDHIVGPIVVTFAVIAIWEATRPTRWVNTLLGVWLLVAPWVLGYDSAAATINSPTVGTAIALFSLVRGDITQRFDGGWSMLWHSNNNARQR